MVTDGREGIFVFCALPTRPHSRRISQECLIAGSGTPVLRLSWSHWWPHLCLALCLETGGRCPEVFPTGFRSESLAPYFSGESVPSAPGNRAPAAWVNDFHHLGVLFGAIGLSLPGRESCCQQWSRSATDSDKKGHRYACHCFSRGLGVGTPGSRGQHLGLLCPFLDKLKVQKT